MIGAFIKQKGTSMTGIVKGMGSILVSNGLRKQTIPCYTTIGPHACTCVIPVDQAEIISPPEEKPAEGELDRVLRHWDMGDPERLNKVLGLCDVIWDEYIRLSDEEKDKLPMWLGKALAEMTKGW